MCFDSGAKARNQQNQQFLINRQDALDREARTKAEEEDRQNRVWAGQGQIDTAFGNFNDQYFDEYKDKYTGYYTPQIDEQFGQAKTNLGYDLASKGLTQSSIGAKLFGDLQKKYDDTKLQVAGQAQDSARTVRGGMETSRNDLYALNNSSADPAAISNRALASASALTAPVAFQPLGDVFGAALGAAATALKADSTSLNPQFSGSSLFGTGSKSSGKVVN